MNERVSSVEACKTLVRRALTHFRLPYITITPTFSICPRHAYPRITGVPGSGEAAFASLGLILAAGVDYELRCTWHPELLSDTDLEALGGELAALGVDRLVLQEYRAAGCAKPLPGIRPAQRPDMAVLARSIGRLSFRSAHEP